MVLIFRKPQENPNVGVDLYDGKVDWQTESADEISARSREEGIESIGLMAVRAVERLTSQIITARNSFGRAISNPKEKRKIATILKRIISGLEKNHWSVYTSGKEGLYFEDETGVLFACKTDADGKGLYKSVFLFEGPTMDNYAEAIQNTVNKSKSIEDEFQKKLIDILDTEVAEEPTQMNFGF